MPNMIEHVEFLSQHIGPRPAGTEEEQQAASYIEDRLKEAQGLSVAVEDFSAAASADAPRCVCSLVTLVFLILFLVLPVLTIPAILLTVVSAALMLCEVFSKPVLSKLFARGVSQNVVARYEPGYSPDGAPTRRRKIVVVSHYDSGKVRSELAGPILSALPILRKAEVAALVLVPVVILLKGVVFSHAAQSVSLVFTVILIVLAVIVVLPVLAAVVHRFAAYSDGANCNASGTAVLLDVAARVGNAWARRDEEASGFGGAVIHGEDAALASGLVPDGARLVYEVGAMGSPEPAPQSPEERLAAAKAAVAALSGKPVNMTVNDISSQLVQVKDEPVSTPTQSEISAQRVETREALASIPSETVTDALSAAAMREGSSEAMSSWFGEEAAYDGSGASAVSAQGDSRGIGEVASVAGSGAAGIGGAAAAASTSAAAAQFGGSQAAGSVPDWFKKAQEKAKRPKEEAPVHRSRYADALDAAERLGAQGDQAAPLQASGSVDFAAAQPVHADAVAEGAARIGNDRSADRTDMEAAVSSASSASALTDWAGAAGEDASARFASGGVAGVAAGPDVPVAVADGAVAGFALGGHAEARAADEVDSSDAAWEGATCAMAPIDVEALRKENSDSDASATVAATETVEGSRRRGGVTLPSFLKERAVRDKREVAGRTTNRVEVSADQAVGSAQRQFDQRQPITLPSINATATLPPIAEMQKQRAPLAEAAVSGQSTAKHLLNMLPSIDLGASAAAQPAPSASPEHATDVAGNRAQLKASIPSLSGAFAPVDAGSDTVSASDRSAARGTDTFAGAAGAQAGSTGAFVPGATGSFAPVSDELLRNVDPEDIYVDDADDSGYEGSATEMGSFASSGYVDMPKSRAHRFFGKFHFGRRKKQEESTPQEWLQVDEEFDARTVGAARGGWESFRREDDSNDANDVNRVNDANGVNDADLGATQAFAPYSPEEFGDGFSDGDVLDGSYRSLSSGSSEGAHNDSSEDFYDELPGEKGGFSDNDSLFGSQGFSDEGSFTSPDDSFGDFSFAGEAEDDGGRGRSPRKKRLWHGGAFSRRMMKSEAALSEGTSSDEVFGSAEHGEESHGYAPHDLHEQGGPEARGAMDFDGSYEYGYEPMPSQSVDDGIEQVYRFRDQAINTEVWFVALGSELAGNGGMNAFLSEHAQDLRGAIVVELEGLGAGTLSLVEREGAYRTVSFSSRMKRYVKKASRVLGESVPLVKMCWRDSATSVAAAHGLQAMHLVGAQGGKPALFGQADDVLDNVEEETMLRNSDFVMELLKNI